MLKNGYEVVEEVMDYIGDEGGISNNHLVLLFDKDKNRFYSGSIEDCSFYCMRSSEQRQYMLGIK